MRRKNADRGRDGRGGGQPASLSVFESFDLDGTGRVSRRNFRRALKELGFGQLGDDEQAAEVLDCFDPRRQATLSVSYRLQLKEEKKSWGERSIVRLNQEVHGSGNRGKLGIAVFNRLQYVRSPYLLRLSVIRHRSQTVK